MLYEPGKSKEFYPYLHLNFLPGDIAVVGLASPVSNSAKCSTVHIAVNNSHYRLEQPNKRVLGDHTH